MAVGVARLKFNLGCNRLHEQVILNLIIYLILESRDLRIHREPFFLPELIPSSTKHANNCASPQSSLTPPELASPISQYVQNAAAAHLLPHHTTYTTGGFGGWDRGEALLHYSLQLPF